MRLWRYAIAMSQLEREARALRIPATAADRQRFIRQRLQQVGFDLTRPIQQYADEHQGTLSFEQEHPDGKEV